jgi:hypothetical protein
MKTTTKTPAAAEPLAPKSSLSATIDAIVKHWKQGDRAISLTVCGHQFEIQDEASFQMLYDLLDRLDNIAAVQMGLDDFKAGRFESFADFKKRLQEKYGLSG